MLHVLDNSFEKACRRYARTGAREDLIALLAESRKRVEDRLAKTLQRIAKR